MNLSELRLRARNKTRRVLVANFAKRKHRLRGDRAYVSFTFDDFPRSALLRGGEILRKYGTAGTYYVAMRLLGQDSEVGPIASAQDLRHAVSEGHEIGCHTFHHLDGIVAESEAFRRSVTENQRAFEQVVPGGRLRSFAYPFDGPRLAVKRAMGGHFSSCRGGGQAINTGVIDLDLLKAYFIDHRNVDRLDMIDEVIRGNTVSGGWLVFATHDVASEPSRFGCRPDVFERIVRMTMESGARVLPVARVCDELGTSCHGGR